MDTCKMYYVKTNAEKEGKRNTDEHVYHKLFLGNRIAMKKKNLPYHIHYCRALKPYEHEID